MDAALAIYPTARKAETLLKEQSRRQSQLGHRILTFPQLIDGLWRQCGQSRAVLGRLGERLVLEEALCEAQRDGHLPYPSNPGLRSHLLRLIREFKSAALQPADVLQACTALSSAAAQRVAALAEVFSRYEARLNDIGCADQHDREREVLWALNEMEASGRRPRFLDGVTQLLVAEIYDFSLLQFMIVTSLIRIIGDARITIQAAPYQVDAARFAELTWNRFVAEESIADKVLPDFVRREGRFGRLGFVLEHLYAEGRGPAAASPPEPDDTIDIFQAPSRLSEVEEIARVIRNVLERPETERIALERIAILARDLRPYSEYIRMIFERYRIPVAFEDERPLSATPLARLVVNLVRIPLEGYRRQALEEIIKSSELSAPAGHLRPVLRDVGYIDHATRPLVACIEDRIRQLQAALAEAGDLEEQRRIRAEVERLASARRAFGEVLDALELLAAPGTVGEHAQRLWEALKRLGFCPPALGVSAAEPNAAIAAQVAALLGELAEHASLARCERRLLPEEFASLLVDALSLTPLLGSAAAGAVQALSVMDARGLDFDLVFILGLSDGGFPAYQGDDPLLPDQTRSALNRHLAAGLRKRMGRYAPSLPGRILRTSRDRNSLDRFLFFLGLSMPERQLVLSYPAQDEAGNPCAPSPFVEEVARLLGDGTGNQSPHGLVRRIRADNLVGEPERCFTRSEFLNCAAARSWLLGGCPELGEAERLDSLARRIAIERRRQSYLELPVREEDENGRPNGFKLALADAWNGRVRPDPRLKEILTGPGPRLSLTQLNALGACGFKFFASTLLHLREEDQPDYQPNPLELGTLAHDVLAKLYSLPLEFRDPEATRAQMQEFLKRYRESDELRSKVRDPAFLEPTWDNIVRMVEEVIAFELAERARGPSFNQQVLTEYQVSLELRDFRGLGPDEELNLRVTGRIDRLELNRDREGRIDRIRVLDYKTSRDAKKYADLADPEGEDWGRTDFQIPVYVMAALDAHADELAPTVVIEGGYIVLRSRDKFQVKPIARKLVESDPQRRARMAARGERAVANTIIEAVASALGGAFDVDPLRCDDYCPYRRVCRYQKPGGPSTLRGSRPR